MNNASGLTKVTVFLFICLALQAFSQTIYVDVNATGTNKGNSWANMFTDLQDALDSTMSSAGGGGGGRHHSYCRRDLLPYPKSCWHHH